MTHKTWQGKASKEESEDCFPPGEYIKFYCYDNIKHENRKLFMVTLFRLGWLCGKIKLLIAANNQLISSSWEAGEVNEY